MDRLLRFPHLILSLFSLILIALSCTGSYAATLQPPSCPASFRDRWTGIELFALTADWPSETTATPAPAEFPMTPRTGGVAAREALLVELAGAPRDATFLAASRRSTRERSRTPDEYKPSRATVVSAEGNKTVLRLEAPPNLTGLFDERWLLAVAVCGADGKLAGYGVAEVAVNPRNFARFLAIGLVTLLYCLVALAAWTVAAERLQIAWRDRALKLGIDPFAAPIREPTAPADVRRIAHAAWRRRLRWKLCRALNPVFVSQDVAGYGSLGRLQLLLFSFAVGFVLMNIYCGTGAIAELPNDVLILLGISVVSNGASRLVPSVSGLSLGNRSWLAQRRILMPSHARLPSWRDIVEADGEIDITRVQALIFSVLVLLALVAKGLGDISTFAVSDEVLYLMGLSQVTYVAGKAIPTDAMRRLDATLDALRAAATAAAEVESSEDRIRFVQARIAAASALSEVYGSRFRSVEFAQLEPLHPLPAAPGYQGM